MNFNPRILDQTIASVQTGDLVQKKVAIYSQKASILLRYIQLTKPKFSRAKASREKLFELAHENHPEIWEKILLEIPPKKKGNENGSHWGGNKTHLNQPVASILDEAHKETESNDSRIITIYSPQLASLFKYLDSTVIRFKTSSYGAELLESKLEQDYPVIWAQICKRYGFNRT